MTNTNSPGYVPGAKDADGSEDPAPASVHQSTEAVADVSLKKKPVSENDDQAQNQRTPSTDKP